MSYLNNAVNGAEGAFVDRAIAQLKQADVDAAEWDRANRQLAQRLLTRENQLRDLKDANVSAAQSIAVLVGDNERLRGELEFLRKQNTQLMNDHARAQEELAVLRADIGVPESTLNTITLAQGEIGGVLRKLVGACDVLRFANQKLDEAKAPKK